MSKDGNQASSLINNKKKRREQKQQFSAGAVYKRKSRRPRLGLNFISSIPVRIDGGINYQPSTRKMIKKITSLPPVADSIESRMQTFPSNISTEYHLSPFKNNRNFITMDTNAKSNRLLQKNNEKKVYYQFGDSLARCGKLYEAFDIYAFIANNYLDDYIPLDRLNTLANSLIDYIAQMTRTNVDNNVVHHTNAAAAAADDDDARQNNDDRRSTTMTSAVDETMHRKSTLQFVQRSFDVALGGSTNDANKSDHEMQQLTNNATRSPLSSIATKRSRVWMAAATTTDIDFDPLLCPVCKDILRCPVTANCGHTFCRLCCESISMCLVCRVKFSPLAAKEITSHMAQPINDALSSFCDFDCDSPSSQLENIFLNRNTLSVDHMAFRRSNFAMNNISNVASGSRNFRNQTNNLEILNNNRNNNSIHLSNRNVANNSSMKFMPDILVRRLVEKWWGPDLQAKKINETAANYMNLNLLDDALKFCNSSLEKSPKNFNSLLLRAEVLRKLCHYQSSLADIDNALKCRSSSPKAHYQRALLLSELGRLEEALLDNCLAISHDKTTLLSSSEIFKHDLAKLLQKLLAQTPKQMYTSTTHSTSVSSFPYNPYSIFSDNTGFSSKKMALLTNANGDHLSSYRYDRNDIIVGGSKGYEVDYHIDQLYGDYDYDMQSRRHGSRKHTRRKAAKNSVYGGCGSGGGGGGGGGVGSGRGCVSYGNKLSEILERIQQEVQRITKTESSDERQQCKRQQHLTHVDASLIDASDFDCVLCCRTFWKPVVTPCGHTYCWVCLDRCMDYSSSCPLCMSPLVEQHQGSSSPVPFILAKRPVTKFLEAAMKRFIPECYEKRFRQEIDLEPSVPVFICTTAFPNVPCPLFVYEPRYRLMVRRAIESGEKQFGIVQPHNGKSRYFDIGTILDIRDCVLLGDGCSILSTVGCKRFKILARNEKDGYETAKVEYIYDEIITEENVPFVSSMHAAVLSKAIEWYNSLSIELKQEVLRSFGEMPPVEENWENIADGPAWAWWIIALLPLNQQLKVDILATTSLEKRLRAIEKTLDYMSGSFRRSQQSCVVVQCEGIQSCQAVECCQRTSSDMSSPDETHTTPAGEQTQQLML